MIDIFWSKSLRCITKFHNLKGHWSIMWVKCRWKYRIVTTWSYGRSIASWEAVSTKVRCSASFLNFQYIIISSRSFSSCLCLLPRLSIPCLFPSITCFRNKFLGKIWQLQLAFLHFLVCKKLLCSLTLCNISSFSQDRPNLSSPSFSIITFQNFQGFQIYLRNCPILNSIQNNVPNVAFHSFLPICCWIIIILIECCFCHGNPGVNFTPTPCIVCYQATHRAEILHLLQLFNPVRTAQ